MVQSRRAACCCQAERHGAITQSGMVLRDAARSSAKARSAPALPTKAAPCAPHKTAGCQTSCKLCSCSPWHVRHKLQGQLTNRPAAAALTNNTKVRAHTHTRVHVQPMQIQEHIHRHTHVNMYNPCKYKNTYIGTHIPRGAHCPPIRHRHTHTHIRHRHTHPFGIGTHTHIPRGAHCPPIRRLAGSSEAGKLLGPGRRGRPPTHCL